jgi:hypothetical protein
LSEFYRLDATDLLPQHLRKHMPEVLWVPAPALSHTRLQGPPALTGWPLNGADPVPLVVAQENGTLRSPVHLSSVIEGVRLERYHTGLNTTLEMRLPFNYSKVPNWVKGAARSVLSGRQSATPEVPFPPAGPVFVVEWLSLLAQETGQHLVTAQPRWPAGARACAMISHDVDTHWLFDHPDWMERICDLEEQYNFFGVWFCVPEYSRSRAADKALQRLIDRGCEIGVHGYNHDAKWPLLKSKEFDNRLSAVRRFAAEWGAKGFRSEWLFRTPGFLSALSSVFKYDSSVPSSVTFLTSDTANGCSSCLPYRTHGGLIELPLSLPMDEHRHTSGLSLHAFWKRQTELAQAIVGHGGLIVLSLHPQPHQAANAETLAEVASTLKAISSLPDLWIARPEEIFRWLVQTESVQMAAQ